MRYAIAICLTLSLLGCSGQKRALEVAPIAQKKVLDVEPSGQEWNLWCWATTAEMALRHLGQPTTQCEQASKLALAFQRWDLDKKVEAGEITRAELEADPPAPANCCGDLTRDKTARQDCVRTGFPMLAGTGFELKRFKDCEEADGCRISWNVLVKEIDAGRPILFMADGHLVLTTGYVDLEGQRWVVINDPWPPKTGTRYLVPYEHFVSGPYEGPRDYTFAVAEKEEG